MGIYDFTRDNTTNASFKEELHNPPLKKVLHKGDKKPFLLQKALKSLLNIFKRKPIIPIDYNIIVYTSDYCPLSKKLKAELNKHNLAYEERRVNDRDIFIELKEKYNADFTPVVIINDKVFYGLDNDISSFLKKKLDLKIKRNFFQYRLGLNILNEYGYMDYGKQQPRDPTKPKYEYGEENQSA